MEISLVYAKMLRRNKISVEPIKCHNTVPDVQNPLSCVPKACHYAKYFLLPIVCSDGAINEIVSFISRHSGALFIEAFYIWRLYLPVFKKS